MNETVYRCAICGAKLYVGGSEQTDVMLYPCERCSIHPVWIDAGQKPRQPGIYIVYSGLDWNGIHEAEWDGHNWLCLEEDFRGKRITDAVKRFLLPSPRHKCNE